MRPRLFAALLALCAALTPAALADTYQFTFNGAFQPNCCGSPGVGPSLTLSFQLSGPPVFYLYDDQYPSYEYTGVTLNGLPGNPQEYALPFTTPGVAYQGFSFVDGNGAVTDFADLNVSAFFITGPDSDPVFQTGLYPTEFELHDGHAVYDGILAVADLTNAGVITPEPSTLALLGTGLAGLATLLRRKPAH